MTESVIVGAGRGQRLGLNKDKAFAELKRKPLIYYSLKAFQNSPLIDSIIAVVPRGYVEYTQHFARRHKISKLSCVLAGGKERKDSVAQGLSRINKQARLILIHDAARPFISQKLIGTVVKALKFNSAVVPVVRIKDTVKLVIRDYVIDTLDRDSLRFIQTPQGFRAGLVPVLLRCLESKSVVYDESMLIEKKFRVKTVEGDPLNIKITVPQDLLFAQCAL